LVKNWEFRVTCDLIFRRYAGHKWTRIITDIGGVQSSGKYVLYQA